MDLINDLGNDLAVAFLVEKSYVQKIESKEVPALMARIRAALQPFTSSDTKELEPIIGDTSSLKASH